MRVAVFTESLPPLTDGVSGTFTRLAETLNAEGMDFLFVSPVLPLSREPWRGRIFRVPSLPFPLYRYYRMGLPFHSGLRETLDRFRPDLVHVAAPTPLCAFGRDYAAERGLPCVASYHTHFTSYFRYYGFGWAEGLGWNLMRDFYNRCRTTYVPSRETRDLLREQGFRRLEMWPRGIDRSVFSPQWRSPALRERLGLEASQPLLLFVGRLVEEKGLGHLVRAAGILRGQGYRFRIAFAGDGPYRRILEGALPRDPLFGFHRGRPLCELYASSDLFVFPSATETFGNVVLEAFASGLPVVAADQGGSAELVTPGVNGLLARAHDAGDLAAKIRRLLDRPSRIRRLSRGALRTASRFDWPVINGRLLASYERLIRERPPTTGPRTSRPLPVRGGRTSFPGDFAR